MESSKALILEMSMKERKNKMGTGIRVNELTKKEQKNTMAIAVLKP